MLTIYTPFYHYDYACADCLPPRVRLFKTYYNLCVCSLLLVHDCVSYTKCSYVTMNRFSHMGDYSLVVQDQDGVWAEVLLSLTVVSDSNWCHKEYTQPVTHHLKVPYISPNEMSDTGGARQSFVHVILEHSKPVIGLTLIGRRQPPVPSTHLRCTHMLHPSPHNQTTTTTALTTNYIIIRNPPPPKWHKQVTKKHFYKMYNCSVRLPTPCFAC